MNAIKHSRILFKSCGLELEGILNIPDGLGPFPGVVLCHPHPQYGGSMDNNLIDSLCEYLTAESILAFKFNFRGVGNSQGIFDNGRGEQSDVLAAISFLSGLKEVIPGSIGLAGYSAGSSWGLAAAWQDARIKALAAISPPLSMSDFSFLRNCLKPVLLVSGSEDPLVPGEQLEALVRSLPGPHQLHIIAGADHSWWGHETTAAGKTASFFKSFLL
jgi:alpha/beta superfamily hydrolase